MEKLFKFLVTGVALAMTLASCNKSLEGGAVAYHDDGAIRFGVGGEVGTKAFTRASLQLLKENGFAVAAVNDGDNSVLFSENVVFDSSSETFGFSDRKYYFPEEGTLSFYAVYPKTQAITVLDGVASLSYTQNADTDLVAAMNAGVGSQAAAVNLPFKRLLSQVSVNVKGEDAGLNYKLTGLSVTSAADGVFSFSNEAWTPGQGTVKKVVYGGTEGLTLYGESTQVGEDMSFIPGKSKVTVAWECCDKLSSVRVFSKEVVLDVDFKKGVHSTLNITLPANLSDVRFTVSLEDWKEQDMDIVAKDDDKIPSEPVSGVFTVNDTGKKVMFSPGNLYWDGTQFKFEEHQYDVPSTRTPEHIVNFSWSKDARVAYAEDYDAANTEFGIDPSKGGVFFAADGGAIEGYTALSIFEWRYLVENALAMNSSSGYIFRIANKSCLIFMPDGFSGTLADTYTAEEWAVAEKTFGLVAIPEPQENPGLSNRNYWSSSTERMVPESAWRFNFYSGGEGFNREEAAKYGILKRYKCAVRLVKVVLNNSYKPEVVNSEFTVNAQGKKVKFAKGNLYFDYEQYLCEEKQYDHNYDRNKFHVSYLSWNTTLKVDELFEGFTVLSKDEWQYLYDNDRFAKNSSSRYKITINEKSCVVLKPDGFSGPVKDSYTAEEWAVAESSSGLVALYMAGHDWDGGGECHYWSSSLSEDENHAWKIYVGSVGGFSISSKDISSLCTIRPVQIVQ